MQRLMVLVAFALTSAASAQSVGLRAPEGFDVTLFAGDDLAHDVFSMTIDARGRVVVAGRGFIKTLHDTDGDGRADRATLFSTEPKSGPHGLCFDGDRLVCTGDDALLCLRDADGDGQADGPPEIWSRLKSPEHGENGVVYGPDGWFYVIGGNDMAATPAHAATPGSPVKQPNCGAVVRFAPDGRTSEIVAHGFRNPYDLDFNAFGHLFTVDADGERDQYLPWYSPTRLFDIATGQHHGWVLAGWTRSWNRPSYYLDSVPRLVEIGRGSPTGVVVYRHRQFPAEYRGNVFSCCWTLGRVYRFPLERAGSSYVSRRDVFLETTGDVGFAPTDLAVGPEGDLFVSIGGRGTRGSVFRVRYRGAKDTPAPADSVAAVLDAPQPLASWSRANWRPAAKQLGPSAFTAAATDRERSVAQRIRAIEVLVECFQGVTPDVARRVLALNEPESSARVLWALARTTLNGEAARERDETLVARTGAANDPRVRRTAWEAILSLPAPRADSRAVTPRWNEGFEDSDRLTRAACCLAAARLPVERAQPESPRAAAARLWSEFLREPDPARTFRDAARLHANTMTRSVQLEAVRLMELALGDLQVEPQQPDVYAGYRARQPESVPESDRRAAAQAIAATFPSGDDDLDRETARLLGMLGADDERLREQVGERLASWSRIEDAVHYLIVLSLLPGQRPDHVTKRTAATIARLHPTMAEREQYASRNWPLRVGETVERLIARDPALPAALLDEPSFRWPNQALFAQAFPAELRIRAARKLAATANDDPDARWTGDFVRLVAALPPDESLPLLRSQWSDVAAREAILPTLARHAARDDRTRFVESLDSAQPSIVEQSAEALTRLGGSATPSEIATALRALRQHLVAKPMAGTRRALVTLLGAWTGERIVVREDDGDLNAAYRPWFDWFTRTHPAAAKELSGPRGPDPEVWSARLARVDWNAGDIARGKVVFEKRSCQRCHGVSERIGPDLAGVAGRLARPDLFTAIIDPSKDVAPLYQTTQILTGSGKVYHGFVVYESPEGTLLQTGPDTTIRVAGEEILMMRKSRQSLMPVGLLDGATDGDLADLFAYMKTLRPRL